jgi:hypothetical protein
MQRQVLGNVLLPQLGRMIMKQGCNPIGPIRDNFVPFFVFNSEVLIPFSTTLNPFQLQPEDMRCIYLSIYLQPQRLSERVPLPL